MPEGDAARRAALRLDAALQGQELLRAELRVPRFATVDLTGGVVTGTGTVGKHLLTRVLRGDEELTVHSHMRMDGRWVMGKAGAKPCAGPGHQIRMWLVNATQQAVGLRLAEVKVVRTRDEAQLVGYLGPDILAADFDVAAAAHRIADHDGQLVVKLLNQRIVCGLGTMWAAEFASHIRTNPYATDLDLTQLERGLSYVRKENAHRRRRYSAGVAIPAGGLRAQRSTVSGVRCCDQEGSSWRGAAAAGHLLVHQLSASRTRRWCRPAMTRPPPIGRGQKSVGIGLLCLLLLGNMLFGLDGCGLSGLVNAVV